MRPVVEGFGTGPQLAIVDSKPLDEAKQADARSHGLALGRPPLI